MSASHDHHHSVQTAARDGVAMAERSKRYLGALDGSVAAHAVTGGVCYCYTTALSIGPDGTRYTAWRHAFAGNIRDIAFAASRDRGRTFSTPVRISEDRARSCTTLFSDEFVTGLSR